MKKITLLSLLAVATVSFSFAQNLKIIYQAGADRNYLNDSTIIITASSSYSVVSTPSFDIINKGTTAWLHAKREQISALPGTANSICFASTCADTLANTNPDSCFISVNDTAELVNAFYGDYYPHYHAGTTILRYIFYNENYTDSGSFVIEYVTTATGIEQLSGGQIGFSAPYPNPANNAVNFNYSLSNGIQSANLKVYNMLGECVQTLPLSASKNTTALNVQTMPSGVYICEVQANGCQPAYQKLIVAH